MKQRRIRARERTVDIWKVHGSLDWFVDKNETIISVPMTRKIPEGFRPLVVPQGKKNTAAHIKSPIGQSLQKRIKHLFKRRRIFALDTDLMTSIFNQNCLHRLQLGNPLLF